MRIIRLKPNQAQVTIEYLIIFMLLIVVILASLKAFMPRLYEACEDMVDEAIETIQAP